MSVDFINLSGNIDSETGKAMGQLGFVFNLWDDYNYDLIYIRTHRNSFAFGKVVNGVFSAHAVPEGDHAPIENRQWYSLKIHVAVDKQVKLFLNGTEVIPAKK